MARILLLIILIWILYIVVKRLLTNNASKTKKETGQTEKVVRCSQCGLHIPESETQLIDNLVCCSNPNCHSKKK